MDKCIDCGVCCLNTEMILFDFDIEQIKKNTYKDIVIDEICHKNEDGVYQLNNINGHCVFFDINTKKCQIYDYRPKGCRFYPMIYDISKQKCIIDKDCPRPQLFYQDGKSSKIVCTELKNYLKFNKVI